LTPIAKAGLSQTLIVVVLPLSEAAQVYRFLKIGKDFMAKVYETHDMAQDALETTIQANLNQAIDLVLTENRLVLEKVNYPAIAQLTQTITRSQRIFVAGEGRSGLVIRMVAMRLIHLAYQVYVVGETTTPSIVECDLLIDCSGSGTCDHKQSERDRCEDC
jgi:D-arabinose 5-phosphate isomerase GutQ